MSSRPATLGQLRASGWRSVPVKQEIQRNALAKIKAGEPLVEGVLGYEVRAEHDQGADEGGLHKTLARA